MIDILCIWLKSYYYILDYNISTKAVNHIKRHILHICEFLNNINYFDEEIGEEEKVEEKVIQLKQKSKKA